MPLTFVEILHNSWVDVTSVNFNSKKVYEDEIFGPARYITIFLMRIQRLQLCKTSTDVRGHFKCNFRFAFFQIVLNRLLIDMEIKDVREFEKQKHKETNEKVIGGLTENNSSSSVSWCLSNTRLIDITRKFCIIWVFICLKRFLNFWHILIPRNWFLIESYLY